MPYPIFPVARRSPRHSPRPAALRSILALASLGWAVTVLPAADWPQWRGPAFNGSSPDTNLPVRFSPTEGVAWSADLPGPSAGTPVIFRDHVFVSATDPQKQTLLALAFDRSSGRVLWQHAAGEGIQRDNRSNFASPSPATDGERVVFFYGNGQMVAFDFAGQPLWRRSIGADYGEFAFLWTFGSTPLLFDGRLYLQVLQRNQIVSGRGRRDGPIDSYLLALDPATGQTLWQVTRASDAVGESREAYSTPIPFTHAGRTELLVAGGDCITGHDPKTGTELWRWGTWNPNKITHWRFVPSPVGGAGIVLACAPKGDPIYALKAGGQGTLDDAALAWVSRAERAVSADVPTPLFYLNDFFVLSDVRRSLSRVEPATGKVKWTLEMPGRAKYEASPTGADGKIYAMNFAGEVVVVDADRGEVLSVNRMGRDGDDMTRSTVAVAQRHLFIRTNRQLFCIGAP